MPSGFFSCCRAAAALRCRAAVLLRGRAPSLPWPRCGVRVAEWPRSAALAALPRCRVVALSRLSLSRCCCVADLLLRAASALLAATVVALPRRRVAALPRRGVLRSRCCVRSRLVVELQRFCASAVALPRCSFFACRFVRSRTERHSRCCGVALLLYRVRSRYRVAAVPRVPRCCFVAVLLRCLVARCRASARGFTARRASPLESGRAPSANAPRPRPWMY